VRGDDVIKSVRPARSRLDDVIYPSLLLDDCAGAAAGCRDCACAAGFRVAGDSTAACDGRPGDEAAVAADRAAVPRQRQRRRPTTQVPCCAGDCLCARLPSAHRKFADVAPPFPTPPPPPPPPPSVSAGSRLRAQEAASRDAVRPIAGKSATTTTFVDNDLMLRVPAAVDERLSRSTGVAACETRDLPDQVGQ